MFSIPTQLSRFRSVIGLLLLLAWGGLFFATHIPRSSIPVPMPGHFDKVCHFVAYGVLAFLLGSWLWFRYSLNRRTLALAWLGLAAYGVVDEWLQRFVNRTPDLYDVLADWAGAFCGLAAVLVVRSLLHMRRLARRRASSVS